MSERAGPRQAGRQLTLKSHFANLYALTDLPLPRPNTSPEPGGHRQVDSVTWQRFHVNHSDNDGF